MNEFTQFEELKSWKQPFEKEFVSSVRFKTYFDSFTCRSRKHGCFFTSSMMMNQQVDFVQPFNGICNTTAYLVQFILKEKSAFLDDETFHTT